MTAALWVITPGAKPLSPTSGAMAFAPADGSIAGSHARHDGMAQQRS